MFGGILAHFLKFFFQKNLIFFKFSIWCIQICLDSNYNSNFISGVCLGVFWPIFLGFFQKISIFSIFNPLNAEDFILWYCETLNFLQSNHKTELLWGGSKVTPGEWFFHSKTDLGIYFTFIKKKNLKTPFLVDF